MSSRKFKFISPGIFINEIDNSQLPRLPGDVGPAIIGRFEKGPALKPTQVNSFEQFVEMFGDPLPGGQGGDVFRNGNKTAPTYAAYAAQAYLRNNSPVTIVRLVGDTNKDATSAANATAGWETDNKTPTTVASTNGGAFGLFIGEHGTLSVSTDIELSGASNLVGIFKVTLSGAAATSVCDITGAAGGDYHSASFGTGSKATADETNADVAANLAAAINAGTSTGYSHGFTATSTATIVSINGPTLNSSVTFSASANPTTQRIFVLTGSDGTSTITNAASEQVSGSATVSGTLAAVWYLDEGSIALSGTSLNPTVGQEYVVASGAGVMIRPVDNNRTFKAIITTNGTTTVEETSFDFNKNSPRFIRKRFNTNPTLTNDAIVENPESYFLGETYEGYVNQTLTQTSKNNVFGWISPLTTPDELISGGDYKFTYSKMAAGQGVIGKTGWFISQDLSTDYSSFNPANMTKLFRLVGRLTREGVQNSVKISIKDIKASTNPDSDFGSFTVAIRDIQDTDAAPTYLEQFNNCSLDPASDNYLAKKIGDKYEKWDYDSKRYKEYGDYPNNSDYIRVEVAPDVADAVTDATYLPFGVFGPPKYVGFQSNLIGLLMAYDGTAVHNSGTFVKRGTDYIKCNDINRTTSLVNTGSFVGCIRTKVEFPEIRLRVSTTEGFVIDPTDAFFGADTTYNSNEFNQSVRDVLRAKPDTINSYTADDVTTENSWVFTLDNIRNASTTGANYTGSYAANANYDESARNNETAYNNHSASAGEDNVPINSATASYENILDAGFDRYTTCLHGGFNALDIKEREPFRNTFLDGASEENNYAYNAISVAIDSLRDPERTEFNMVAMPGLTNNTLNSKLVRTAEGRGDALAIIDPQGGYIASTEGTKSIEDRIGSVNSTVNNMQQNLKLNSSYGAAYYPWVQIRDTVNGATLWAPPSVAAIGALSYSEAVSELWFAPAGFTRGGLSANNAAGLPVVGVRQRLTSKERDKLYENNINPIASFPAEGIVIFGQKTLQTTPSALDRINVRRLTIFLKREISRIAATLLFDQNVKMTWNKFRGQAERFLAGVKSGLGLTDYKVILDESTTTPDLIDRNILYAKIFVKPARAIEFIAIDFVITDSGAAFDD